MSMTLNGNGNSNRGSLSKPSAKRSPNASVKDTGIAFQTADGVKLTGTLVQATQLAAVFEMHNLTVPLRLSEVLGEFEMVLQGRVVYAGRAVLRNLIDAGSKMICEATLDASQWTYTDTVLSSIRGEGLANEFKAFLREWEKVYKITPEFKLVTADMQAFLQELNIWLDKVELNTRTVAEPLRTQLQGEAVEQAAPSIINAIDGFIERFEAIAGSLRAEQHPSYQSHFRRHLHPMILTSPFAYRAYTKPLGYAGDYGVVNMMLHPTAAGETLFAKTLNVWLLGQAPAQAHRNRVAKLEQTLVEETMRARSTGTGVKILNLGCGPADEVQMFLKKYQFHKDTDFTLVDFNEETLEYVKACLRNLGPNHERAKVRLVKKSVLQILRDSGRSLLHSPGEKYNYIYCAGLFDYLQTDVCKQILTIFYNMLASDGLLLATNASEKLNSLRPFRFSMEYLLDWRLIYRDRDQFLEMVPDDAPPESVSVSAEEVGVNLFLKIRKPDDAND